MGTILLFIFVLGLLVFVHELGHFVMAKRAGMTVEEFGFGFPPRIAGVRWKGKGTLYSINWIPLGGFVKILGEDGETEDEGSFRSKSFWARVSVIVAGVLMNMLLAWLLLAIVFGIGVPTVLDGTETAVQNPQVQIVEVVEGSPAATAGLTIGDAIISVDGVRVSSLDETLALIDEKRGEEIVLGVSFGDDERNVTVTPRAELLEDEGALGVGLVSTGTVKYPWYEAIWRGGVTAFALLGTILVAFAELFRDIVSGAGVSADLAGPVGIAVLTGQAAKLGIASLLQFTAVLSVNLALINILPLPALDGGRLLFLIIEKVRGKRVPEQFEGIIHTVGFIVLLLLMLVVTVRDVSRFWDTIIEFFTRLF